MTDRTHQILAIAAMAAWACAGCSPDAPDTQRVSLSSPQAEVSTLAPELQAQLDSGNVAFRAGDAETALRHYTEATRLDPDVAAGWYGVAMAQTRLGNQAAAQEATQRVQQIAPELSADHPSAAEGQSPHAESAADPHAATSN